MAQIFGKLKDLMLGGYDEEYEEYEEEYEPIYNIKRYKKR